jgi:hypothetical protein
MFIGIVLARPPGPEINYAVRGVQEPWIGVPLIDRCG